MPLYISKTCTWIKDDIILLLKFNVGGFSQVLSRFNSEAVVSPRNYYVIFIYALHGAYKFRRSTQKMKLLKNMCTTNIDEIPGSC